MAVDCAIDASHRGMCTNKSREYAAGEKCKKHMVFTGIFNQNPTDSGRGDSVGKQICMVGFVVRTHIKNPSATVP
jgi:hypothetical protein